MDNNQPVNILLGKTPQQIAAEQKYKEELERRSEDLISIFNPFDESYICYWNSYGNELPPRQVSIHVRYIAEKAMGEMIDLILSKKASDDIKRINDKRHKEGQPLLTPRERERIEEGPEYKISEKKLRAPYVREMWRGIFKENLHTLVLPGKQLLPQDTRPIDEQLIEQIDYQSLVDDEVKPVMNKDFIEGVGVVAAQKPKTPEDVAPRKVVK